jgi:hypothetical protein
MLFDVSKCLWYLHQMVSYSPFYSWSHLLVSGQKQRFRRWWAANKTDEINFRGLETTGERSALNRTAETSTVRVTESSVRPQIG